MDSEKIKIPLSPDFRKTMLGTFPESETDRLLYAIDNKESATSIRFNIVKSSGLLSGLYLENVGHCDLGRYLPDRPSFIADPLFHAGVYYVQESSSMVLYQIKDFLADKPVLALDMCAAPGGKSTLLNDILPHGSVLVSNEVIPNRANVLRENIQKWGGISNIVTSSYPKKWGDVGEIMDLVLVDAPCSGEGMFRKDMESRIQWTKDSPYICSQRQKEILHYAYKALKEDGLLIYSTCTYNRMENEDILDYIVEELGGESIALSCTPEDAVKSCITKYHAYRFMPHVSKGEGLFFAVVRKKISRESEKLIGRNKTKTPGSFDIKTRRYCEDLLEIPEMTVVTDENGSVWAMPVIVSELASYIGRKDIKILSKGVEVGAVKGKDIVPSVPLVLSNGFYDRKKLFHVVGLSREEALSYLRGEQIILSNEVPKGFVAVSYKNINLGLVKNIGNRVNNLYPNHWRIKKPINELATLKAFW